MADSRRCLDESVEPLLTNPSLPTIVVEEVAWDSGRILSNTVRILLEEFLGYEVVMNSVGTTYGSIRRAALPEVPEDWTETDGETLKEMLDRGADFAYVAVEVWAMSHQLEWVKKYSIESSHARLAGAIGFDGRSGWYVPKEFSVPPYGLEFYRAFHLDNSTMGTFLEVSNRSFAVDCAGPTSCTCCQNCTGPSCGCCQTPLPQCDAWCPGYLAETPSLLPLPFFKPKLFDVGRAEEIIQNNGFHMAARQISGPLSGYEKDVADNLHSPLVFFSWMPSLLPLKLDVVRAFLPQDHCGVHSVGSHLGTWRCDYVPEIIQKLASGSLYVRAPLAWKLISSFEVESGHAPVNSSFSNSTGVGILHLLSHLDYLRQKSEPETPVEMLVEEVACRYVRDNIHIWEALVTRPVPWWADMSEMRVVMFLLVVSALIIVVATFAWERFWVQSGLYGKRCSHCGRCCVRCWRRCKGEHLKMRRNLSSSWSKPWVTSHGKGVLEQLMSDIEPSTAEAAACESDLPCKQQGRPSSQLDWAMPEFHLVAPGEARLQIRRYGDLSGTATVRVKSSDCDAEAGKHFVLQDSDCVFESGQDVAWVRVDVYVVPTFGQHYTCPSSFHLELTSARGGELLRPGFRASVTIAGSGRFLDVDDDTSPQWIVRRFIKILAQQNPRKFCLAILCCGYASFHDVVVMTLSIQVLVDFVYAERLYSLAPIVVGLVIPSVLLDRWAQRSFVTLSDAGPTSRQLRNIIFRKFWHQSILDHIEEKHRARWVVTMSRVGEATLAWETVFQIIAELAALVFSYFVLIVVTSQWFRINGFSSNRITHFAVLGLALSGAVGYGTIVYSGRALHFETVVHEAELDLNRIEGQFLWSMENWPLLVSHVPRIPAIEILRSNFVLTNNDLTRKIKRANMTETSSLWISEYVTQWIMIFIMYHGIVSTIDSRYHGQGSLTVGGFFAVIKVVRSVGTAMWKLQRLLLSFTRSGELLQAIASLLDKHGTPPPNVSSREITRNVHNPRDSPTSIEEPPSSSISLNGVSFKFMHTTVDVLDDCSVEIPLGGSYVVDGPPSVGKRTLMQLLLGGRATLIRRGEVVMPPRIRASFANGHAELVPGLGLLGNILASVSGRRSLSGWGNVVELLSSALLPHGSASAMAISSDLATPLTSKESLSELLERYDVDHAEPGLTEREMCMLEIIRAILRDPDLLLVNLRAAPEDAWMDRVHMVLNIWHLAGGLNGLIHELEAASVASLSDDCDKGTRRPGHGVTDAALRVRLKELLRHRRVGTEALAGSSTPARRWRRRSPRALQDRSASKGSDASEREGQEGGVAGGAATPAATATAAAQRTLVVLPHSVQKLRVCESDFGFRKVIHLVDSSTCRIEELR